MPVELRVETTDSVKRASKRLRENGNSRKVRAELITALKLAAQPAVVRAKNAALSLPAKSNKRVLRRRTADAISSQVRSVGKNPLVRVRVSRTRMREKAPVPLLMDRGDFRHRVFGREVWVTQHGFPKWFEKAVGEHPEAIRREIKEAANRIERKLS